MQRIEIKLRKESGRKEAAAMQTMAYVQVPKDLTRVKTKFILNLTKRQCLFFGLAAAVGIPFYLLTKDALGTTISASIMILIMLPFFFFAMYEKDGRHLEQLLMMIYEAKVKRPGVRIYKTENLYAVIQNGIYEKEVLKIGEENQTRGITSLLRGGKQ